MEENGARVNGRTINNLRFINDIGLMAQLFEQAQPLLDRVQQISSKYGQEMSESKIERMLYSTKLEQTVKKRTEERL